MKNLFLALAIVGTIGPYWFFVPWLADNGLDIPGLVAELFSTRIGAFFGLDVVISALVLFVFMLVERSRRPVKHVWVAVIGTLGIGVSCGLPLYLYLRENSANDR